MQQKLPRRGQAQQAVGADKQHNPKLLLQGRDCPADGGVAGIQGTGRFRKAPMLRRGNEQAQLRKLYGGSVGENVGHQL